MKLNSPRRRIVAALAGSGLALVLALAGEFAAAAGGGDSQRLQQLAAGPQRSAANRARDVYRHPVPTLEFIGLTPRSRVIEILPGSAGYWTEILAPYLRDEGAYIAALPKANPERAEVTKALADTKAKYAADPVYFSRVAAIEFSSAEPDLGPSESVDAVLTFRNLHNWLATGTADTVIAAVYRVLRRGGVLAIEEHRGRTDQPQDPAAKTGYVREDYAIGLIEKAGFKLRARSEINANPKDTKDYAAGVWTLPPTYRLKDQDRNKYAAIGESDRFLLTFVKP